jgi:hypothetical protein
MSTTTNFKRIALVAVAALGLGVLSSVPSQAVINSDLVTLSTTTAAQNTAETFTATSAVATVSFLAGTTNDSMTLTAALVSGPTGGTALPVLRLTDTTSATVETLAAGVSIGSGWTANTAVRITAGTTTGTAAKFAVYLATAGATTAVPAKAGTYVVRLTPAVGSAVSGALIGATAQNLTIVVTDAPTLDVKASASTSKVYIQKAHASGYVAPIADSSVVVAKTAQTNVGFIFIDQLNAASGAATESITAEITGSGTLGFGKVAGSAGRSLTVKKDDTITVWADGTAGIGTITIKGSTSGNLLSTKTVTFYGAVASFTGTANKAILSVGANARALLFSAKDSASNTLNVPGADDTYYAFSSDTTIATVSSSAIGDYTVDSGTVTVTGVKAGTVTITIGNASTLAASTIKSTPVSLRVGATDIASVKVAFDKTSYAPGEKAILTVAAYDSTGALTVPATTEIWSTVLTVDKAFSQGSIPASDTTTVFASSTSSTTPSTAGMKTYVVYMPSTAGTVTVTGVLVKAAPLAAAIQGTTITGSVSVVDSGSAALAAVTALASTVAQLRTLIVTLTNLVLKIQKKVKA